MVVDRNTWQGRAHTAWGASRSWNSGASFEAQAWSGGALNVGSLWSDLYTQSQAALTTMTTDRNTWQGRANTAWGASRSWSSGTSFEAQAWTGGALNSGELWSTAYARVLPAELTNQVVSGGTATLSGSQGWRGAGIDLAPWIGLLSVPYAGNYCVSASVHCIYGSHNDDGDWASIRVTNTGGGILLSGPGTKRDGRSNGTWHATDGMLVLAAGAGLKLNLVHDSPNAGPSTNWDNIQVRARFMPTPANAH